jgi:hypothetical protein
MGGAIPTSLQHEKLQRMNTSSVVIIIYFERAREKSKRRMEKMAEC